MASPFTFRTKPTGPHETFRFDCPRCRGEATVTNGKVDRHECADNSKTAGELLEEVLDALSQ